MFRARHAGLSVLCAVITAAERREIDAISVNDMPKALHEHGIGKYEAFHLPFEVLEARHERHRRSRRENNGIREPEPLKLSIQAHGQVLDLRLTAAEHDIFSPRATAHSISNGTRTPIDIDRTLFYHGKVLDRLESQISMYIDRDALVGSVFLADDHLFVERASKYGIEEFSNIIYRGSDMVKTKGMEATFEGTYYSKLLAAQKKFEQDRRDAGIETRKRREWEEGVSGDTCEVLLIGDNSFLQRRDGAVRDTTMEMIGLLDAASLIYRFTAFNPLGTASPPPPGVAKLAVAGVEVYVDSNNPLSADVSCAEGTHCAQKYLDKLTTMRSFDQYCLVHAYTNLDFAGGILGLAWVATAGSNSAGICARHSNGRSANTGISTAKNFDKDVSWQVQVITLAHEFGHNHGSNHDTIGSSNGGSCAPGGDDGMYIMYEKATDGDKANNDKFSPCSTASISSVLRQNSDCFVTRATEVCGRSLLSEGNCGNTIWEVNEECECGSSGSSVQNHCNCATCTIVEGKQCSPDTDVHCCNEDGTLKGLSLERTLDNYRSAFSMTLNGTHASVDDALAALMLYDNGDPVEVCSAAQECNLPRYCVNDERFVPYKGQILGSCPNVDYVVELAKQQSQAGIAADVCFNFTLADEEPAELRASSVPSCQDLTTNWNSTVLNTTSSACYLFHKSDSTFCSQSTSLCRWNGCTGSICDKYGTIDEFGNPGPVEERALPCSMSNEEDTCKIACRFAAYNYTANAGLCTVLSPDANGILGDYPNYDISLSPERIEARNLANGRSCYIDGEAGGGRCDDGACIEYKEDLEDQIDPEAIGKWIEENWQTVLIIVVALVMLVVALKLTYHKNKKAIRKNVKRAKSAVAAKTMSKGAPRPRNSKSDLHAGSYGRDNGPTILTTGMRHKIRRVMRKEEQFLRLQALFPKTSPEKISHIQGLMVEEKDMVKRLLKANEGILIPSGSVLLD